MNKTIEKNHHFVKIINYIGSAFIFIGISYFIFDNWNQLNNFTRLFSTLGASIAAFMIGICLHLSQKHEDASSAFFMLAGLLLPLGLHTLLLITNIPWSIEVKNLFISAICLSVFLASQLYSARTIFLLFTILFASLFYLSIISLIVNHASFYSPNISIYSMMALGLSYIFLGYYFDTLNPEKYPFIGALYLIGGLFLLSGSFSLSSALVGLSLQQWQIITPILIILAFYLAVPLRSKSFLYLGAIFLFFYICDISTQFIKVFGDMGWSLILILLGLTLITIGYVVIQIKNTYLNSNEIIKISKKKKNAANKTKNKH